VVVDVFDDFRVRSQRRDALALALPQRFLIILRQLVSEPANGVEANRSRL